MSWSTPRAAITDIDSTNTPLTNGALRSDVAYLGDGYAVCVWQQQSSLANRQAIYESTYNPSTETWAAPSVVIESATRNYYRSRVEAHFPTGGGVQTHLVFEAQVEPNGYQRIVHYYRSAYTGAWSFVGAAGVVQEIGTTSSQSHPSMTLDEDGLGYCTYLQNSPGVGDPGDVFINQWSGAAWAARAQVSDTTGDAVVWNDSACNPDGDICAVYVKASQVFYKLRIGGSWGSELDISPDRTGTCSQPAVTSGNDGKWHVVWLEADGAGTAVRYKYISAIGGIGTKETAVATNSNVADPQLSVDGAQTVHLVNKGSSGFYEYRRRLTAGAWGAATQISSAVSVQSSDDGGHLAWVSETGDLWYLLVEYSGAPDNRDNVYWYYGTNEAYETPVPPAPFVDTDVHLDVLVDLQIGHGADRRKRLLRRSEQPVAEFVWHRVKLPVATTSQVDLGGVGANTLSKWLYVETDEPLRLAFTSRVGATNVLTTVTNLAHRLVGDAPYLARLTNTTHLWIRNPSATNAALVHVVVAARTSA